MSSRRLVGMFLFAAVGLGVVGVAQAGAATPSKVLKFHDTPAVGTALGFDPSSSAPPAVGSRQIIALRLENSGSQFGKPSGTKVGRVLIDCTVMAVDAQRGLVDGNCLGIAHVPDGYFTFEGPGGLSGARVAYWAVTGGVGPYADVRGQIKVVNHADGSSDATVTLYSP